MDGANYRDAEFVSEVAEDVLGVLKKSHFFARLERHFCARRVPGLPPQCAHTFALSIQVLRELGMDAQDIGDVLAVLRLRGASCDCEVLQNVADPRRLKPHLWNPAAPDWLMTQQSPSSYLN